MKKVMMFMIFMSIANILLESYWIKKINNVHTVGDLYYDTLQGRFHAFSSDYTSFNQDGQDIVYRVLRLDNGIGVFQSKIIRLDDGNFFGIGQRFRIDVTKPGEKLYYYYVLGFTDTGDILFSKEIKNIGFSLNTIDLIQFNDKIKFIGSNANNNGIEGEEVKTAILTFKTDGTLLKVVELSDLSMDSFGINFWCSYGVKVDSDHYGIVYTGYLSGRKSHYSGIWFFKLNQDEKIVFSKFYGIKKIVDNGLDFDSYFGPVAIKGEDDGKFLLAVGREKYINWVHQTNGFSDLIIKLDSNFNIQWSKEYIPQFDPVSLSPINILKDSEGYTIGIDWRYHYSQEEDRLSPIIFKTDMNGKILWSKKYQTDTIDLGGLRAFLKIPLGLALMTDSSYFFVLTEDGEIPGDESISEDVTLNCLNIALHQQQIDDDVIKISGSDIYLEDTAMSFHDINYNTWPPITEYRTLQANCSRDIISERGLFSGHYEIIDNLTFQVDSIISPYVHNFKIYGRDVISGEYSLLKELNAELGRNGYEIIFKYEGNSRYIGNSEYKIVAFNEKYEVIDMTSAISPTIMNEIY